MTIYRCLIGVTELERQFVLDLYKSANLARNNLQAMTCRPISSEPHTRTAKRCAKQSSGAATSPLGSSTPSYGGKGLSGRGGLPLRIIAVPPARFGTAFTTLRERAPYILRPQSQCVGCQNMQSLPRLLNRGRCDEMMRTPTWPNG